MNVTLGVPRLKEIINASNMISTPIIEARLVQSDSMTSARIVKAQIEKTTLGEVVHYIKEVNRPSTSYVAIKLDMDTIQSLHLNISPMTVKQAILNGPTSSTRPAVLRLLKERHVVISERGSKIKVFAPDVKDSSKGIPSHQKIYFVIQALKAALPTVIVQGIPSVSRAVINEEIDSATGKKNFYLLVEGYGMQDVMGCPGVRGNLTTSNHIVELQKVLGIEAARSVIASEIKYIMQAYGITVDRRHLMLLSDVMTFKGEVLGITRFGVAKMKESVLMLASFEKTTDHLFDAAVHSREDSIVGVSECIIMGVPIPIGTGLFKLLLHPPKPANEHRDRRVRLLDTI
jgi:DNA-directed RNA polymerase III subunit RPC1